MVLPPTLKGTRGAVTSQRASPLLMEAAVAVVMAAAAVVVEVAAVVGEFPPHRWVKKLAVDVRKPKRLNFRGFPKPLGSNSGAPAGAPVFRLRPSTQTLRLGGGLR